MSAAFDWDRRKQEFHDRVREDWKKMELSGHAPRVLANAEIDGIEQLLTWTKKALLELPGMGNRAFFDLESLLSSQGWVYVGTGRPIRREDWEAVNRLRALGWRIYSPQY